MAKGRKCIRYEDLVTEMHEGAPPKKLGKLCYFWRDTGHCERGDSCRFLHPEDRKAVGKKQSPWLSESMPLLKSDSRQSPNKLRLDKKEWIEPSPPTVARPKTPRNKCRTKRCQPTLASQL